GPKRSHQSFPAGGGNHSGRVPPPRLAQDSFKKCCIGSSAPRRRWTTGKKMRRINVIAVLCCSCVHASAPAKPATIDNASQAAFNSDYATARSLYLSVARTTADAKERETADLGLAKIEWRIEGNPDAARLRLNAPGTSRGVLEESRLERDLGRYSESEALARKAMALAQDKGETRDSELALVEAIVGSHLSARRARRAPPAADLREAFDLIR